MTNFLTIYLTNFSTINSTLRSHINYMVSCFSKGIVKNFDDFANLVAQNSLVFITVLILLIVIFCALFQGHYKDTHEKWRLQLKTEKYRKLLFSSSKGIVHDPSKQPDFSKEKLWNQFIFGMKNFHPVLSIGAWGGTPRRSRRAARRPAAVGRGHGLGLALGYNRPGRSRGFFRDLHARHSGLPRAPRSGVVDDRAAHGAGPDRRA